MKKHKFEDEQSWLDSRLGKISGSRLKDIVVLRGNKKKIGFYELIAERLALPSDGENPLDRGHRLEIEAIERFEKETKKKVDSSLLLLTRDDNESIAISPDGLIGTTEAVEVKCLSSARHLEALLTNEVPNDYYFQVLQYFVVIEKLKTLYLAFYDPRLSVKDFFFLTIQREDVQEDVEKYLDYQRNVLAEITEITNQLSF